MKNRPFRERLGFALAGLRAGFRREASFRTQMAIAGVALVALLILRPDPLWWAVVAVTVALVLALELINSALEAVIDLLHPGLHPEIKAAKDMLAGAVLTISIAALVVGIALMVTQAAEWMEWMR
ncbi:diacylglycerol kinase [Sphingomonas sp. LT1P40]|uniref:diacylglycerol kinase n=1 Tax=Alteristakelama amylovorans TaxID=3096166 RepID=UPI002FCCB85F